MTIYRHRKSCKKCGGFERYESTKRCAPCARLATSNYRNTNKQHPVYVKKSRQSNQSWYARNKDYVRSYNRARYELRKSGKLGHL